MTAAHKASNLAWKRTLGVMLAVRLGWEFVFFVDDDITPYTDGRLTLSAEHLAYALRAMREDSDLQAVSWPSIHMADNGVVGHARPLVGLGQDVFVSGSAILLRVTTHMAFFPYSMYNEDWLMMVQLVAAAPNWTRALARAGGVRQKPYDCFSLQRALHEEPGELVGEGLMSMIEDHGPALINKGNVDFWARVKQHRRELLYWVIRKRNDGQLVTWSRDETPLTTDPVTGAMNAALWSNDKVTPEDLRRWVHVWWQDQTYWRSVLLTLADEAKQRPKVPATAIPQFLSQPRDPWVNKDGEGVRKEVKARV
ncbi:hypothetical protein EJ05DRAFT_377420 [Pseudovirgaria hyperparasitica]|uniref:Nucleotide-diphospho-sugar transferase domain-containing protein n=1 Tax=Pseudovirgaria hyperparasitica TaxID=470096 RepID=A0A6A6WAG4_9PEZI|nr:uncharacterized protein EJ05DRAFT_377420 [Pseudovirgaria hyperparasitica]KAF2758111.1 hypothetical protein EJ05DRAFT_377420 [Pseudovirgaria hyperparasitica]